MATVGAGSAATDVKRESGTARLLGSGMFLSLRWIIDEDNVKCWRGLIGSAGIAELLVFHPVCLLMRTLFREQGMTDYLIGWYHRQTIDEQSRTSTLFIHRWKEENWHCMRWQANTAAALNQVIFKDYATASVGRKFTSLFPGLGYAAGYKVHIFSLLF